MSYPGQPPMGIPGMPPMPYMVGAPPPIIGGVMPMAHMIPTPVSAMQTSAPAVRYARNQNRHDNNRRRERESGPPVTVFIGNIMERAPDVMIRHILGACGHVLSWKRVQAFGFCEYAGPDAGLRAVRLLHDMEIGTKKLVVKVDAKAKVVLDQFKAERRKKLRGGQSPLQDETSIEGTEGEEGEDYMDEGMRVVDADALARINQIIAEHAADLEMAQAAPEEHQTKMVAKSLNLDDAEIEESKRDLITREIGKFREVMKAAAASSKQEEEKAQVKRKKEAVEKEEREKREKERRDRRDGSSTKDDQDGDLGSPTSHKGRSSSTGSSRRDKRRSKSREEEEEAKERKKNERRAREKEAAYQERLRAWETRERRKQKEYEKEAEKRRAKREAREREAKRLKEFLEDYDDERDDAKYYKGKELSRRLEERALEAEADSRDRCAERQELQRLRDKLYADASHPDPAAEFERLKAEREEQYKPKPVITIIDEEDEKVVKKEKEVMPPIETEPIESDSDECVQFDDASQSEVPSRTPPRHHHHHRRHHRHHQNHHRDGEENEEVVETDRESVKGRSSPSHQTVTTPIQSIPPTLDEDSRMSLVSEPEKTGSSNFIPFAMGSGGNRGGDHGIGNKTPASPSTAVNVSSQQINQNKKKGRIDVKDVFNNDDDDDGANNAKKRKLVPLDYGEEKKKKSNEEAPKAGKEESTKSQEEKRKHIKSLIDKIPTDKNALFGYQLDWAVIDNTLMEKRIRPWINKKIIEYIGEPEPTLVDFICSKVMAGSSPQGILDDVQMVLDEEAEVFVVKMWRLLIYEVEAKKMGLVK
ncbi:RNA-binding protein [Apis cerana cerana]|uniref:RNA-binding protein n=1 Tax=Apis cerana cerana TaxID=94128 RepID=A0A2A3ESM0_APICC|nr:RNA-binding protein [Apis cerana cerana]